MDKAHVLQTIKDRDNAFINKFCQRGDFMGDGGAIVNVCRPVNVDEMLTFMHQWDAAMLNILEDKK